MATALGACAENPPLACTEEARPGLSVTVRDSVTGAAVASGVEIVAHEGEYADTARASLLGSGVYALAYERAGVYDVTVSHPAYRAWARAAVRVTADECHVQTVSLLARLAPI
jgi:fructose-1,6-bisphosphatase/inositol monophosphatase family enzyme